MRAKQVTAAANADNSREALSDINSSAYLRKDVVEWYGQLDVVLAPEQIVLEKLAGVIKRGSTLDIGFGGGRSTGFLTPLCGDYTGIDYSQAFVEHTRSKYPDARLLLGDVRDLDFENNSFECVLFLLNGIDYVNHSDRITALNEIMRVLKPGGYLFFSTHNRDYEGVNKLPWKQPFHFTPGHLKTCLYTIYHLPKHFRMKKHELNLTEYAIINDNAHAFSLLTYHISIEHQVKQLKEVGFVDVEAYSLEGEVITSDTTSAWIHFLASKPLV